MLAWSLVTVGNIPLELFCQDRGLSMDEGRRSQIDDAVRHAACRIIEGKGATYYGVGSALARIVSNIIWDRRSIMTVCTPRPNVAGVEDVTVSLPSLVGGDGVLGTFPQPLSPEEHEKLHASATIIRAAITDLERAGRR